MQRAGLLLLLAASTAAAAEGPPGLRLGDEARPVRYAARLRIIPGEPTFRGAIDIDLTLARPARVVWMNGADLRVESAAFTAGGATIAAKATASDDRHLGFAADRELPAGAVRLHVDYSGPVSMKDDRGLFAQQEAGRWYAFTQLEAISARRVFPCFDEPSFKVPWQLTVEARRDDVILSNTDPVSEKPSADGKTKVVTFAATPPLPSYLVALAVGPFAMRDLGRGGRAKLPLRIAAPAGRAADVAYAAATTAPVLAALEEYFGTPYPYGKLDQVSVPQPTSFGAMENPALITWAQGWIVARPEDASIAFQRNYASVAAHEIAHQWFGDLVTLAWWDDTWLNESFASWLAGRIVDRLHPEWFQGTEPVLTRSRAMRADVLSSARQIRQPIAGEDDIFNAFDSAITYDKGEVVLDMFERFLGEATFQKAIRRYIADHAGGNATAADFFAALSAAAGRDLRPAIGTFLDQPGVPLVHARVECAGGRGTLRLGQERYVPLGATAAPQTWQVPVCARWSAGGKVDRACTLVGADAASLPLGGCPDWLLANDGEAGYYRVDMPAAGFARLLGKGSPLEQPEIVGLLDDVNAMVARGSLPAGEALGMLPPLAADTRRRVVDALTTLLFGFRDGLEPDRARYARFVQQLLGARARQLGWQPLPGDDEDTRQLRPAVVGLVADAGEDRELRAQAVELARRWLHDRKAIAADVLPTALAAAASVGDRALFDAMLAEARRATERRDRIRLLDALAEFHDPALAAAALDLMLDKSFDARESSGILFNEMAWPPARPAAWEFFKRHYDELATRWAADSMAYAPFAFTSFCDAGHRDEMSAFFKERWAKLPGGPRLLTQAIEATDLCIARRRAQTASASKFLARY